MDDGWMMDDDGWMMDDDGWMMDDDGWMDEEGEELAKRSLTFQWKRWGQNSQSNPTT